MDFYDVLVTVFYLIFIYALAMVVRSFYPRREVYQKFFLKGLTVKLIGGLSFAAAYTFYFDYGGDSMAYYGDARLITDYFYQDPFNAIRLIINPEGVDLAEARRVVDQFRLEHRGSEFPVVRAAAILNIIALNSYFSTSVLFATLSFVGIWHFFLVFARRYPEIQNQLAWAIMFIPSVFFWGSGIMKDSMVIGFLGLMLFGIDRFLQRGVRRFFWLAFVIACGIIIFSIKAYVIMALTPALVMWVVLNTKDRIRNKLLRALIVPVLLILSLGGVAFSIDMLGRYKSRYSVENFVTSAQSIQAWHYVEGENTSDNHGRGSSYTLGEYEPTIWGVLSMFPAAVNVSLFRPYLWEIRNPAMALSALESSALLVYSFFIFIGLGFFRVIRLLFSDPFLLMCLLFAIFFAFAVGFTSYNFGALARYKIPAIPFYVAGLMILNYKVKKIKEKQRARIMGLTPEQMVNSATSPVPTA